MRAPPPDVAAYLDAVEPDKRAALLRLRRTILASAPGATERLSYAMPSFFHDGGLVSMAAFKGHCSLFAGHTGARIASGHPGVEVVNSTIRFAPKEGLPPALVREIVRARLAENAAKRKSKGKRAAAKGARER